MTFQIEITRFTPEPVTEKHRVESSDSAAQLVQLDGAAEFVIYVAALDAERRVDYGNFYLTCNAKRAVIELQEHCEHSPTDPNMNFIDNTEVIFRGEDGSCFSIPYHRTLTPPQAMAALTYWLPDQKWSPNLKWV